MKIATKADRRERVHLRQRKRIAGTEDRPRLTVFRVLMPVYAGEGAAPENALQSKGEF